MGLKPLADLGYAVTPKVPDDGAGATIVREDACRIID
jgi:hypothetical protein